MRKGRRPGDAGRRQRGRAGLRRAHGMVGILRHEAQHPVAAEAHDQPVDEIGHGLVLDGAAVEARLRLRQRLADRHGEAHRIEAEAGIERVGEALDALAPEPQDGLAIARRAPGLDRKPPHRPVAAMEADLEDAPALAALLQHPRGLRDQPGDHLLQPVEIEHRLGEMALDQAGRRRAQRREPGILMAEHAPQPRHQVLAETGRQCLGGALGKIGQRPQARPGQGERGLGRKLQRRDRQRPQPGLVLPGRHDPAPAEAGQRMGGLGRARDGRAERETAALHPAADRRQQRALPAEEMGAAGDVEQQALGAIERDQRGEAIAEGGEPHQQGLVGLRLGLDRDQPGNAGPRVGQGQVPREPQARARSSPRRGAARCRDGHRPPAGRQPVRRMSGSGPPAAAGRSAGKGTTKRDSGVASGLALGERRGSSRPAAA